MKVCLFLCLVGLFLWQFAILHVYADIDCNYLEANGLGAGKGCPDFYKCNKNTGKCECNDMRGLYCYDDGKCEGEMCGDHGNCVNEKCVCDNGWYGPFCEETNCETNWIKGDPFKSCCYRVYGQGQEKTRADAKATCENSNHNSHLVYITSPEENDWLKGQIPASTYIGLLYKKKKGQHIWDYNNQVLQGYSNWAPGEPDLKKCVTMQTDGKWKDGGCRNARPFVCKKC